MTGRWIAQALQFLSLHTATVDVRSVESARAKWKSVRKAVAEVWYSFATVRMLPRVDDCVALLEFAIYCLEL